MATFLVNEIYATDRDVTGPTEEGHIMFPSNDKTINWLINNVGYLKPRRRRWINSQRKANSVWYKTPHWKIILRICCARRSPKIAFITVFISIVAWKQARRPPLFSYVFNISLSCDNNIPSFIGNLWWVLLPRNHLKSMPSQLIWQISLKWPNL